MQRREATQEEIENAIFNQKERYNEQLGRLYQVSIHSSINLDLDCF